MLKTLPSVDRQGPYWTKQPVMHQRRIKQKSKMALSSFRETVSDGKMCSVQGQI